MFDLFRSQQKAVKYFLTFLLSMVALSMVITLIPGLFSTPSVDLNDPVLADVGDESVTINDVQETLQEYQMTGQARPENMGMIAQQVIETQIGNKVLMQEAQELGIKPTQKELADWIRDQMPFLWQGGEFNGQQYAAMIQQRFRTSVPSFEARLLQDLTIQNRLKPLVTDNIVMTEEEVKQAYRRENETAQIRFAVVNSADFRSKVEVTDEKLAQHFEANKIRYRIAEKVSLKLITLTAKAAPPAEVSEAEIQNYYQQNMYRFETQNRVLASHILFMTIDPDTGQPLPDDQIAAKEKLAHEVLEKVKAGGDFAELAKQYSEDPGNKDQGGDLGWVTTGQMAPSFEQATFALKEGEVSDVVKTEFGFHIIEARKKDAAVRKPLDEVRDEIIADIRAERAEEAQYERADEAARRLQDAGPDKIDQVAAELGLPVQTKENIARFELSSAIPSPTPQIVQQLTSAQPGDVLTHTTDDKTIFIAVSSITPARDATLDEVRDKVRNDYIQSQIGVLARDRAEELLKAARDAGGLQQVAGRFDVKVQESNFFRRDGQINGFTGGAAIAATVFNADPGTLGGPVSTGTGAGVYEVVARQEADMTQYFDKRQEIRSRILEARQDEMFKIFQSHAIKRYEDDGKIKRYDNRIAQYIQSMSRSR